MNKLKQFAREKHCIFHKCFNKKHKQTNKQTNQQTKTKQINKIKRKQKQKERYLTQQSNSFLLKTMRFLIFQRLSPEKKLGIGLPRN